MLSNEQALSNISMLSNEQALSNISKENEGALNIGIMLKFMSVYV